MSEKGKKSKKTTGKVTLTEFLVDPQTTSSSTKGTTTEGKDSSSKNWGEREHEDNSEERKPRRKPEFGKREENEEGEEEEVKKYQEYKKKERIEHSEPKKIDESLIPTEAPFIAYIGNLSYDISKKKKLQIFLVKKQLKQFIYLLIKKKDN